jgi:plastocyanin
MKTTRNMISVLVGMTISVFMLIGIGQSSDRQIYGQNEIQTSETGTENMSNVTAPQAEIHQEIPAEKTFYVFTSEVENVDESKLGVAGDSFDVQTLVANQGDKVNVNFYNVDDVQTERHSFKIDDPYEVNIDLGFDQKGNATFTAGETGVFTYYCAYHLPVMKGQLVVLP